MSKSIAMLGATGAVGAEVLAELLNMHSVTRISTFGRRTISEIEHSRVQQHTIDIFDSKTYKCLLKGHHTAICTLGVGQPSTVSKEDFVKIDKTAVIDFAAACKQAGVKHFELLSSIGFNPKSRSFYLRTKGELVDQLRAMEFDRLSIFMPSMILTPENRYDWKQAVVLKIWPLLHPLLAGGAKKYRGVKVRALGVAIAENIDLDKKGYEELTWNNFQALNK